MGQTRRTPFTVLMLPREKDMLEQLCMRYGVSQNAILRRALTAYFTHDVERVPTCANGNPCLAPHMYAHVQRPPTAPAPGQTAFPPSPLPHQHPGFSPAYPQQKED